MFASLQLAFVLLAVLGFSAFGDGFGTVVCDTFDANGNTLESRIADLESGIEGNVSDVYDFRNRLIRRARPDGTIISLIYDADSNRVGKIVLDAQSSEIRNTAYLVDLNNHTGYAQVVEEWENAGGGFELEVSYLYGHDLISQNRSGAEDPDPSTHWYLYDGHGSVVGLADVDGAITDEYEYDAFGVLLSRTGSTENAYLYTGEQFDADLGMYFLRARYLNAHTGRFHTLDTYEGRNGEPLTLHKYLYAHANPVMNLDPSGNITLGEIMAVVSSIAIRAQMAVVRVAGAVSTVVATGTMMLRNGFHRVLSVLQFASQRVGQALTQGQVLLRRASGGWRLRVLKLRNAGIGRSSYEILNFRNILRFEAHPINPNWPSWVYYPHGHLDFLGTQVSKFHIPVLELGAALLYFANQLISDDVEIEEPITPDPEEG